MEPEIYAKSDANSLMNGKNFSEIKNIKFSAGFSCAMSHCGAYYGDVFALYTKSRFEFERKNIENILQVSFLTIVSVFLFK